jgi:protein-glutamine gamma-glutamyltransferase
VPFEQAFRLSAVLLAAIALAGLFFARIVPAWLAVVAMTIMLFTLVQIVGWPAGMKITPRLPASPILWNGLLISAFLLFLLDVTTLSRELLPAGVHFLVMLLGIKLVTLHDRRDYRQLYAICLMAILASAALTTEVWYILVFLLYLVTAVWTLLLYHLTGKTSARKPAAAQGPLASGHITSRFFWLTNGIAVCTFGLTLVLFFLLPRISVGILQKPHGEGLKTTGFSEQVDLGMIGSVKEDPQIVMRVELPDQPGAGKDRLYLRGLAYDHYNGRSWSATSRHRRSLGLIADGTFVVRSGGSRTPLTLSEPLRQDILLEPLDTSVLFAAPFPEYVDGEFTGVQADSMTGLHLPYPSSSRIRYSVTSRERQIMSEEQLAMELDYSSSVRDRYLQLPEESNRIAELARGVTDRATTPYEKTSAVLQHLLSNYRYSLDGDTITSTRPIEDFLFTRKTGYCEHYATAMVLMLRSLAIPARLVTGFLATEWNDFGSYYTVRQRDAHAWVEVYYPHSGWITMDPTPAAGPFPPLSVWDAVQRIGESLRLHWDRVFIRYGARDQLAVVQSIREGSDSARDVLSQWMKSLVTMASQGIHQLGTRAHATDPLVFWLLVVLPGIGLACLILVIRDRWQSRRSDHRPSARKQQQIVQLYKKMLEIAGRRGIHITPSTTPIEFTQLVGKEWTEAESTVAGLTSLYCQGRFSRLSLSSDQLTRAVDQISALQRLARATRPSRPAHLLR